MRLYALPVFVALAASAGAQVILNNGTDLSVRQWMASLSLEPMVSVHLYGTQNLGNLNPVPTPEIFAWFYVTTYPTIKGARESLQVRMTYNPDTTRNSHPTELIVGDAVNLWHYTYATNSYTATSYGNFNYQQPANYYSNFFRYLGSTCTDLLSYPATLLSQVYSAAGTTYQSWLPASTSFLDTLGNANYTIGTPPTQNIIFVPSPDPLNALQTILSQIQFDNIQSRQGLNLTTQWTTDIVPLSTIDASTFQFTPPVGARLVASPKLAN